MHFTDAADGAVGDPAGDEDGGVGGGIVDGQGGGDLLFAGKGGDAARLGDGVGHGLLAEHMFAMAHGGHGNGRVPVVGGGDIDRVEVLVFVEEFAEVAIGCATFV